MSDPDARRRNFVAGWVTMGLLAAVVLSVIAVVAVRGAAPAPRTYVVYVTDSGTLRDGDPVILSGRHIGSVTDTEVVSRDGTVQTRVEIEIFTRFRHLELPSNSRASIGAPGMVSGPRLYLFYGSSDELIEADGEIEDTSPAPPRDDMSVLGDQLENASRQIDALIAVLNDDELIGSLKAGLVAFRDSMEELSTRMEEFGPGGREVAGFLSSRPEQLADILAEVRYGIGDISGQLDRLAEALDGGADNLDAVRESTCEAIARLEGYGKLSADAAAQTDEPEMRDLFLRARWQSAEMAAMLRLAVENPAAAGDYPGAERRNRAFNGGKTVLEPFGGTTNVDDIK